LTVTAIFASTNDGFLEANARSYQDAAVGASLTVNVPIAVDDTSTVIRVGQFFFLEVYVVDQGFIEFDTSSIPDNDNITVATLSMFYVSDFTNADFTIEAVIYDWSPTLESSDYYGFLGFGDAPDGPVVASRLMNATGLGTLVAFTSNANMLLNINKLGTTQMMLYSLEHKNFSTPTANEFVEFRSADQAGTTQDPVLTITHNSVPSKFPYTSRPRHVWRSSNIGR